jgi:superfamily I DNA/RNA helicase
MPHDPRHPKEYSFDELETAMFLTERQVAEQLHIKPCTIRNARLRGGISYVRVGSRFYYIQEHIDDYIREHTNRAISQQNEHQAISLALNTPAKTIRAMQRENALNETRKQLARERVAEIFKHPPRKTR